MSSPATSVPTTASADIGVVGLAVMGSNLARNFAHHGHTVALFNRTPGRTQELVAQHGSEGSFVPSVELADFVASLAAPRQVLTRKSMENTWGPRLAALVQSLSQTAAAPLPEAPR